MSINGRTGTQLMGEIQERKIWGENILKRKQRDIGVELESSQWWKGRDDHKARTLSVDMKLSLNSRSLTCRISIGVI
jgi:hypothetical protein